jgi:hypothetical protein
MLVGRKIHWDVKNEKIVDDAGASELLSRPYRAPWGGQIYGAASQ